MAERIPASGPTPQTPTAPVSPSPSGADPDSTLLASMSFEDAPAPSALSSPKENAFDFSNEKEEELSPGDKILQGLDKLKDATDL